MNSVAMQMLKQRGVTVDDMAQLVLQIQQKYNGSLTLAHCRAGVCAVLAKREIQHAIVTGLTLDKMAEENALDEPLGSMVREGGELFGMDVALGLAIVNVYGSIGLSNYGYLIRKPPRFLAALRAQAGFVGTFLNDIVAAIVAAACARVAHQGDRPRTLYPSNEDGADTGGGR